MKDPNFIAQEAGLNFGSVVEAIIKRSCIVDYGIIQNVVADGVVDVSLAVSRTEQDMFCMTCVLANIASSSFTLNIKPKKGDRVLVVYPRIFDDDMFTVPEEEDDAIKPIINFDAKGYNLMSGIAILINQYKEASHKNLITVDEGKVTIALGYNADDDKNMLNFTSDENGAFTVSNDKCSIAVDKDGYLDYENTGDSKTKVQFTSSGMTIQDSNGCNIVSDSEQTVINGNLKIKKSGAEEEVADE